MASTEIKAAFRVFCREKSYTLINLAGLILAVVCCLKMPSENEFNSAV